MIAGPFCYCLPRYRLAPVFLPAPPFFAAVFLPPFAPAVLRAVDLRAADFFPADFFAVDFFIAMGRLRTRVGQPPDPPVDRR